MIAKIINIRTINTNPPKCFVHKGKLYVNPTESQLALVSYYPYTPVPRPVSVDGYEWVANYTLVDGHINTEWVANKLPEPVQAEPQIDMEKLLNALEGMGLDINNFVKE